MSHAITVWQRKEADISDINGLDDRRRWAIDQMVALCRNASVPKDDEWVTSVVDFLAVHGFYTIRKASKKSNVSAVSYFLRVLWRTLMPRLKLLPNPLFPKLPPRSAEIASTLLLSSSPQLLLHDQALIPLLLDNKGATHQASSGYFELSKYSQLLAQTLSTCNLSLKWMRRS